MQNEAGQRLIEFCQENALVIANTLFQQLKRRIYTLTSPDGQHRNQIHYILCSQRWKSSIQSTKTRPGADCGSDHELLITKFRLKLKKVGKIARQFRYDLNQIPYDYTVEVRNRFKCLDLIDRVRDELWNEVHRMLKLKLQYFGHLMRRVDSLEKTDAGRDWGQEEKGTTEDEMAGWHH